MNRVKGKRPYSSTVRREQAARTRSRILEAAGELYAADGYARTTIKAIAARADVAVDTVYAAFGSKARVLTAVIDVRLAPSGGVGSVLDTPEVQAIRDAADQRLQIRLLARWVAATSTRVRPVYEILRTASAVEPEMAEVHAEMEGYRLRNLRQTVEWVASNGPLRVDLDRAVESVWALASPDVAALLCDRRGWSEEQYADWLEDLLIRSILARDDG